MIEVVSVTPWVWREVKTYYEVHVDGQSVARFPSRDEAEAYAERLREEAGDANGG
jgi:hypothetical protein